MSISRGSGGVAFLAHVGGFLAGVVFGVVAARLTRRRSPAAD
jgi:membrane associated rhomboid family serine protease